MKQYLQNSVLMKEFFILLVYSTIFAQVYAQDYSGSFYFEGKLRRYSVYLPQNFRSNMPVIFNLHGYGYTWTISNHARYTLMHEIADTTGFIVIYPAGSVAPNGRPSWNNGLRDHPFGQTDTTANDVGFLLTLIDTLYSHYDIDLNQVYCCGFSMGGEMTYRMAIEVGDRFAAFASVSGKINDGSASAGIPAGPYSILHFHGTDDDVETYDGENDGNLWPVEETIGYWLDNNNCMYESDTVSVPNTDLTDGSTVQKISYLDCADNSRVIFYKILEGGHGWPGSARDMYINGKANRDINASLEIVNFFKNIYLATSLQTENRYAPNDFALKQNYPNPFNPSTTIKFSNNKTQFVTLKIYNPLGQEITTLVSEKLNAGKYQYIWHAGSLASGVYLYRLRAGEYVETLKMILIR
jgi:polyhydroxybutyrate depolymerase